MKIRITITDEDGGELGTHIFEIAGLEDYQQASGHMWDCVRETLAKRASDTRP
jgi:hypothetical protein